MAICLNRNSVEYQTRLRMSGLSEFKFNAIISDFVDRYERFPELDEIPGANSKEYFNKVIPIVKIGNDSFTQTNNLLRYTNTSDIGKANIKLNNIYKDLEIQITPLTETSVVSVKERPTRWRGISNGNFRVDSEILPQRNVGVLNNIIERLASLYGINFIETNNAELASEEWSDKVNDAKTANAFIYNGDIYINTDNMKIDAPLHEMLHLVLGSVRFSDPELYRNVVRSVESIPDYTNKAILYKDRTKNDINEEVFISEFSRYMTGQSNIIENLDEVSLHKLFYNMNRVLDSTLFGEQSVSTVDSVELFNSSLIQLSKYLGSALTNNSYSGTLDLQSAEANRILSNVKSDLLKGGELKEFCG